MGSELWGLEFHGAIVEMAREREKGTCGEIWKLQEEYRNCIRETEDMVPVLLGKSDNYEEKKGHF